MNLVRLKTNRTFFDSKCITTKKSRELIRKLEGLTSRHIASQIRRNRDIDERIKCKNEEFYYNIEITEEKGRDLGEIDDVEGCMNTSAYMKKIFRMFGGDSTHVQIKFTNELINVIIDRFGEDAMIMPLDENHFKLTAEVNAGDGFLSWILQLGPKAQILYPEALRDKIIERIDRMKKEYKSI